MCNESSQDFLLFAQNPLHFPLPMYKSTAPNQTSFDEFNRSCGMNLDPSNDWCRIALLIPWHKWVSS